MKPSEIASLADSTIVRLAADRYRKEIQIKLSGNLHRDIVTRISNHVCQDIAARLDSIAKTLEKQETD